MYSQYYFVDLNFSPSCHVVVTIFLVIFLESDQESCIFSVVLSSSFFLLTKPVHNCLRGQVITAPLRWENEEERHSFKEREKTQSVPCRRREAQLERQPLLLRQAGVPLQRDLHRRLLRDHLPRYEALQLLINCPCRWPAGLGWESLKIRESVRNREKKKESEWESRVAFNCKIPSLYTEFGAVICASQILAKIPPGNLEFPKYFIQTSDLINTFFKSWLFSKFRL